MTTDNTFKNPMQAWTQMWMDGWSKLANQQATAQASPAGTPAGFPFAGVPFAMPWAAGTPGAPLPVQPWLEAWTKALPPAGAGLPVDPITALRLLWVDLPVEVAGRLQKFSSDRMQDQMRLLTELAAQEGSVNPAMRYAGFLQQASLAWGTELLQILELYQEKLQNTDRAPSEAPIHYPRAAA